MHAQSSERLKRWVIFGVLLPALFLFSYVDGGWRRVAYCAAGVMGGFLLSRGEDWLKERRRRKEKREMKRHMQTFGAIDDGRYKWDEDGMTILDAEGKVLERMPELKRQPWQMAPPKERQ